MDYTDTLADLTRQAGWLDEGSDEQAVFLLQRLTPLMADILAQVQRIAPTDLDRIATDLRAF